MSARKMVSRANDLLRRVKKEKKSILALGDEAVKYAEKAFREHYGEKKEAFLKSCQTQECLLNEREILLNAREDALNSREKELSAWQLRIEEDAKQAALEHIQRIRKDNHSILESIETAREIQQKIHGEMANYTKKVGDFNAWRKECLKSIAGLSNDILVEDGATLRRRLKQKTQELFQAKQKIHSFYQWKHNMDQDLAQKQAVQKKQP